MLDAKAYLRIMRASAAYDLIVSLPFATPWTLPLVHTVLVWLGGALGLPGQLPPIDPMSMLLGNLMGSVVVVWSVARLRLGLAVLGRYDAVARFLFAAWQINALLNGLSLAILPLLIIEIAFGIVQLLPISKEKRLSLLDEQSVNVGAPS